MTLNHIFHFYGGVHPREAKVSSKAAIVAAPLLEQYTVPLAMHIGAPATPVVKAGDMVKRGQLIGQASGFVSANIHSPTSGKVKAVDFCLGAVGTQLPCVVIESDDDLPMADWQDTDPNQLLKRVGEAGIVGMGGAAFPTQVKLSIPPGKSIDTLIINGVECEPCLTADHRLMLEAPQKVLQGVAIAARILNVTNIVIAIENNKADAIKQLSKSAPTVDSNIRVAALQVCYPQGSEKQLIYTATKRQVPSGGLPADVHCVVMNVGSAFALSEAVIDGKPLYERVTTVTGTPIASPGNWRFRVGTPFAEAIKLAGGIQGKVGKLISGGPMMGMTVYSQAVPIVKSTSGILLLAPEEVFQYTSKACLRCGRCNDACPMQLMPGILSTQIENERFDDAQNWNVMDCIECGCCAFICPAGRPLVQHMRRAKAEVGAKLRAQKAAAQKAAEAKSSEAKQETK